MNPNLTAVSRSPGKITVGLHRPGVFMPPTVTVTGQEAREFAAHLNRIADAMQVADENLTALAAGQRDKVVDREAEKHGSGI